MNGSMDTLELRQSILHIVASIPQGKVASYGQVARLCGYSGYARYVGMVLKQLPSGTTLPWHRVINSRGEIVFPIGSEAHSKPHSLLVKEGVNSENGRISMRIYGWSAELMSRVNNSSEK